MLEAKILKSAILKRIVDVVNGLLREATFNCSGDGINLLTMDDTHVCMVNLRLNSSGFTTFRCDGDMLTGVDMARMCQIMSCCEDDDTVGIHMFDEDDTICITFDNPRTGILSCFEMNRLELCEQNLCIPEIVYPCIIKMPSARFTSICNNLSKFGDYIAFVCLKDSVAFAVSNDNGTVAIKIPQTDVSRDQVEESVSIEVVQPLTIQFPSYYLNLFCKAAPLSSEVILSLSSGFPLCVEYQFEELGYIQFYLSPKVENDD